jgi:hypothetical protein
MIPVVVLWKTSMAPPCPYNAKLDEFKEDKPIRALLASQSLRFASQRRTPTVTRKPPKGNHTFEKCRAPHDSRAFRSRRTVSHITCPR